MTELLDLLLTRYNYVAAVLLLGIGVYMIIESTNLVKKVVGLNVFQTGIFLFFITSAYREGGGPPVLTNPGPYVSPLPHVLILTAIVVGVSLVAVALALIVRIYSEYGTLDEDVLREVQTGE
ncbi:cation:proton antiporter subunit C [Halomarina ordinaria]|uniref:Cation:proton antiporter subunit C n=1 Tax=Halomarina ordinaria TaxID=3033939 RepID=A0ABD5UBN8_9EURY|nr:cation:proton antiporter subunit C [Halomarina sp. PSRA2]